MHRLLAEFPATHPDQSGAQLYVVYNITKQTIAQFNLTDERVYESSQFRTGNWLRGRLYLADLAFYNYRRFALIDENYGYFVSRVKTNANPLITAERQEWRARAIPLKRTRLQEHLPRLTRKIIDVTAKFSFDRRAYGNQQSRDSKAFRVVGARNEDTDDYHLYVTNLPEEFTPEQIGAVYCLRWGVELLFRELKSVYGLEKIETSGPVIVELLTVAALLTVSVSRALLGVFQIANPELEYPRERWLIWLSRSDTRHQTFQN